MKTIVVTGEKGGVGKSTIACLLTEWLLHSNRSVRVIDADPNETTREWVESCAREGRRVSSEAGAGFHIIDTAGRSGGGIRFVEAADIIVAPFQPLTADISSVASWFLALHPRLQRKVAFVPNRLRPAKLTNEERSGLAEITKLIKTEKYGVIIEPGLFNRPAVYPLLFDGSRSSFFEWQGSTSLQSAQCEAAHVAQTVVEKIQKQP